MHHILEFKNLSTLAHILAAASAAARREDGVVDPFARTVTLAGAPAAASVAVDFGFGLHGQSHVILLS